MSVAHPRFGWHTTPAGFPWLVRTAGPPAKILTKSQQPRYDRRAVNFLTDFADQAVILPLVAAIAVALLAQGWWRGAIVWLGVVGATFAAILGLKLTFLACTPVFGAMDIRSPSGHVAAATVVVGGLATLLSGWRHAFLPSAVLAALVIGISRGVLGAHSLPEVAIGATVGLLGAMALVRLAGRPPRLRPMPLVAVILIVVTLFHGMRLPAEAAIRRTAWHVAQLIEACRPPPNAAIPPARTPEARLAAGQTDVPAEP
jgi:membrane-associated phospholipid phosphatase